MKLFRAIWARLDALQVILSAKIVLTILAFVVTAVHRLQNGLHGFGLERATSVRHHLVLVLLGKARTT